MATLGDDTSYTTRYDMSGNTKVGVLGPVFNISGVKAYITQISAKIYNEFGRNFMYAIYKRVNDIESAELMAYTVTKNTVIYGGIVTAALTSPITLDPARYALSILCDGTIGVYGGTKTDHDEYHDVLDTWSDGFSDPFYPPGPPVGIHNSNFSRCIYAEYTPILIPKLVGSMRIGITHRGR